MENPDKSKEIAKLGALGLANKIKEMSYDERMEWVKRSCNNEESNKKKTIAKSKNTVVKYCKICNSDTFHLNNMCTKCHPSSGTGRTYDLAPIFHPSFKTENDILYYYDKSNKQYIPWEDYKAKFNRKRLTKDVESFINSLKSLDIFQPKNMGPVGSYDIDEIVKLYPTFRTQESDNWANARNAFEQSLIEAKIDWFVYIKFFIDQLGCIKPLVVGKSGSLNVNANGSDISFSTNVNDGPARRFLIETKGASWDKTHILIIKAKSEQQALFYEWKISDVYGLFES